MQLWEVELERAPLAGGADDGDLSAEDPGDLAADREPEPRSAVPAAGAAVRLLERFEDDLLLLGMNADARVADREDHYGRRIVEHVVVRVPSLAYEARPERHAPVLRELEGVREEVPEHLQESLRVGVEDPGHPRVGIDREFERPRLGDRPERPLDVVDEVRDRDACNVDGDGSGFDLGEVEDVVDELEQVVPRGVDRLRVVDMAGHEIPLDVRLD